MLTKTSQLLKSALIFTLIFTIITGVLYPLFVTALGRMLFSAQANGSMVRQKDVIVGSRLIGQAFNSPKYFWGRPSATQPFPYNAASSAGSNLGPLNPALLDAVKSRIEQLNKANPDANLPIPIELLTTSASGLDPHISLDGALYQAARIAKARNLQLTLLENIVRKSASVNHWSWLGYAQVNVLKLNLLLDSMGKATTEVNHNGRHSHD